MVALNWWLWHHMTYHWFDSTTIPCGYVITWTILLNIIAPLRANINQWTIRHGKHHLKWWDHYNDVIMSAIASQITSLVIVYSTVYSGADQRKYQSSPRHWPFLRGIHRGPVSPHKGTVSRKMSPFDEVFMISSSMNTSPGMETFFGPKPWVLALHSVYIHVSVLKKWDFVIVRYQKDEW